MPRISSSRMSMTYALRKFPHSHDGDYKSAIQIYVTNIGADSRTNSNEITYWIDQYDKQFEDDFCVCGFYLDGKIIGFSQFTYFHTERLVVFDYLVLHKHYRTHGEYHQFVKLIHDWIDSQGFEFDFAVAEVSFESTNSEPSEHSIELVHVFGQVGFSVADCCYYQPCLGLDNPQSDVRAHLLIASRERLNALHPESLSKIVHTIYFKHYERWYKPFLEKNAEALKFYHDSLLRRFQQLTDSIAGKTSVELDGIKPTQEMIRPSPAPRERRGRRLAPAVIAALCIWLMCLGLVFIQWQFNLSTNSLLTTIAASLVVFVAAFALFDKQGQKTLERILDFMTKIFGSRK